MKTCNTYDLFNEQKSPFEEPVWQEALESSIHSEEELELAISACPFPFEEGGVESLEVPST